MKIKNTLRRTLFSSIIGGMLGLMVYSSAFASNSVKLGTVTQGSGPVGHDFGVLVGVSHDTPAMSNGDNLRFSVEYMNYSDFNDFNGKAQYVWNDPLWDLGVGIGVYSLDSVGGRNTRVGIPVSLTHNFKNNFLQLDYNFIPDHQRRNTLGLSLGTNF